MGLARSCVLDGRAHWHHLVNMVETLLFTGVSSVKNGVLYFISNTSRQPASLSEIFSYPFNPGHPGQLVTVLAMLSQTCIILLHIDCSNFNAPAGMNAFDCPWYMHFCLTHSEAGKRNHFFINKLSNIMQCYETKFSTFTVHGDYYQC